MKRLVATILPCLMLATPAWAGFDSGMRAYQKKDYKTASREFRPLAEQGNASAQYYLGRMYYNGWGLPLDNTEAVKWFKKAAEQGYALAQFRLGLLYVYHWREEEGAKWYKKAAEQGYALAQDNLALMYALGHGVPQDHVQAHKWWLVAGSIGLRGARQKLDKNAQFMTSSQIAEARQLAREWRAKIETGGEK